MSSDEDEDIASIEEESRKEGDEEEESLVSDDGISVGGANDDRTKCKCSCCEKVHRIKPDWTHETDCPSCGESIFKYMCQVCSNYCYSLSSSSEPAFPNQPCAECDKTRGKPTPSVSCVNDFDVANRFDCRQYLHRIRYYHLLLIFSPVCKLFDIQ